MKTIGGLGGGDLRVHRAAPGVTRDLGLVGTEDALDRPDEALEGRRAAHAPRADRKITGAEERVRGLRRPLRPCEAPFLLVCNMKHWNDPP